MIILGLTLVVVMSTHGSTHRIPLTFSSGGAEEDVFEISEVRARSKSPITVMGCWGRMWKIIFLSEGAQL